MIPMGTMARLIAIAVSDKSIQTDDRESGFTHAYVLGVMGTLWRESRMVVNLARPWVMAVAKTMCHVVRKSAVCRGLAVER